MRILVATAAGVLGGAGAVVVARRHVGDHRVPGVLWAAVAAGACAGMAVVVDDLRLVVLVWMAVAGTALSAVDAATSRLPNAVLYPTGAVGAGLVVLIALIRGHPGEIATSLVGTVVGVVPLYVVWLTARSGGLGFGDVRFSGWLGMHLGVLAPLRIVAGLLIGLGVGVVVALVLAGARRRSLRDPFPLGPYLALGSVLSVPWLGMGIGG